MSLDDADLTPQQLHRRDIEAWEDRSIPGHLLSTRDLMRRAKADDLAERKARADECALCESEEAMESHWRGVFAAMPEHVRNIRYRESRGGIDPRLWGP